jgi:long-chain acyl-CoA synthetase
VLLVPNRTLVETTAKKRGLSQDWEALLQHTTIHSLFRQRFDAVNKSLPVYAQMRKFTLLTEPFSQDRNELTPTLKVKRHEVLLTRQAEIAAMYPTRNVPPEAQPQAS